jgi:hypothetical protein
MCFSNVFQDLALAVVPVITEEGHLTGSAVVADV